MGRVSNPQVRYFLGTLISISSLALVPVLSRLFCRHRIREAPFCSLDDRLLVFSH